MKTVKLEVTAQELQGIAVALGNSHWKLADLEIIKGIMAKIEVASKEFQEGK